MLIAALGLTLNLAGNGRVSLFDRDEPRYAGCTREMRARGDWIYPTFNGEPRFHKPILIYWLMRGGHALGGDNPFGARLVSAIAGTATSLVVLVLGRRIFGPREGLLAALMLTTSPIMVIESKLATTDATLTLWIVAAQLCLWELSRRSSKRIAAGFWVLIGLATLTKGPVGLALIACAGVASWWWGGPTSAWKRLHWRWGLPLFLLVTAPWYIAVGILSRGEFFRFALGKQVAERVVSGVESHGAFPGYYVLASLLLFHPWVGLLPAAIRGAWEQRKARPEFGFLLGWVVGPLLLLESVRTKLVHYYLPAYPACALLGAWLVVALTTEGVNLRRWPLGRLGLALLGGVGVGLTSVFLAGSMVLPTGLGGPSLAVALVVGLGTLWGLGCLYRAETLRGVKVLAANWTLTLLILFGWMLPRAEPYRLTRIVGERLARLAEVTEAPPVLLSFQEPTLVYTMGRSATMLRTWTQLYDELDRNGVVATAILKGKEMAEFQDHRDIEVDVRETVTGFNIGKGKTQTLHLALLRRQGQGVMSTGRGPERAPAEARWDRPRDDLRRR